MINSNSQDRSDTERSKIFIETENVLKRVISKCDEKTLKDVFVDEPGSIAQDLRYKGIRNCVSVEVYKIDGLHIYKVMCGHDPIDYLISDKPLYLKEYITDKLGNRTLKTPSTGYSFLEYSKGGKGNSISIPVEDGYIYTMSKFIGMCTSGKEYKPDIRVSEEGSSLYVLHGANKIGNIDKYINGNADLNVVNAYTKGDLFGYLYGVKSDRSDKPILDQYKSILNKVHDVSRKVEIEELENSKRLIIKLFNRNKQISTKVDAFTKVKKI